MNRLLRWIGVALLDLRGDLRRFSVLIACLALGVATIAVVGSVGASLQTALARDARVVLGGDLEAQLSYREASADELALFDQLGTVSQVVEVQGRGGRDEFVAFLSIRAVDANYPLLGAVSVESAADAPLADRLAARDGVFGAVVDPLLLDRLQMQEGDRFRVGDAEVEVRGVLTGLPDQVTQGVQFGVPIVMSVDGVRTTGILEPGVLARYRYKLLLESTDFDAAAERIRATFPDAGFQIRAPQDATEDLSQFFDVFSRFLIIVGLSALLVGGVGVSNAVSAYVTERQRSVATLRALGATSRRVMVHFLAQVLTLTLLGIAVGVVLGAVLTLIALPIIGGLLSISLPATVHFPSLLLAAGFGLLIGFAFGYLPLKRTETLKPAILFRTGGAAVEGGLGWRDYLRPGLWLPLLVSLAAIFGLAVLTTGRPLIVMWYALGVLGAFIVLRLAAFLLQWALRLLPPLPRARFRNALKAIHRPGSPAPLVILSLGLGLALLLLIALIDGNLRHRLDTAVAGDAPSFVFMDLFEDDLPLLADYQAANPKIEDFRSAPMLRGSITALDGKSPDELGPLSPEVSWLFENEIPLTFEDAQPEGADIVEGEWWPTNYQGEPLISVFSDFKEPLNLEIGSTITFLLFGQEINARVASFRDFEWRDGSVNFSFVLSPNAVGDLPISYLGLVKVTPGAEREVQSAFVRDFPDLIFMPVGDALVAIAKILDSVTNAVALIGGLAVVSGLFVLAGAMAAGRKQREADAVVMKVLGATRGDVTKAFLIEYGLLGGLAAVLAALLGLVGAWGFVTQVLELDFSADWLLIVGVIVGSVLLAIATGAAVTWGALSTRPARFLRTE